MAASKKLDEQIIGAASFAQRGVTPPLGNATLTTGIKHRFTFHAEP
jgi:hypothetical protein